MRAERERFHDIGSAPESAVDDHLDALADGVHDFRQRLERRHPGERAVQVKREA